MTGLNSPHTVSVSLAAYDGYETPQALESLARLGVRLVEPAYGPGTEPLDGSVFSAAHARRMAAWLRLAGLGCDSVWADLDLAGPEAGAALRRRLNFAAALGARLLLIPASRQRAERRALAHLAAVSVQVEALGLHVALAPSVEAGALSLPHAADFVAAAQLPWLGLDFGTAAAAQTQPGLNVADQFEAVRSGCLHLHLGDVRAQDGWFPVVAGQGAAGCDRVLRKLARHPLPMTLDLPLRWHHSRTGQLRRAPYRVPLPDIEAALACSLAFVSAHLSDLFFIDEKSHVATQ